ncbi:MAG: DUF192 domain-containing protein [Bryobacter sp.]|nr:DUF192 domain-containing protein [Bryobacter sp.]
MRLCLPGCTLALLLLSFVACSDPPSRFGTRPVTMPNGATVYAESAIEQVELLRGLMFRDSLVADGGLLFIHNRMGKYPAFMYQVKFPIDIIWMDRQKTVVEIAAKVPPCTASKASECPTYGGNRDAQFLLEIPAGKAAEYRVSVGSQIDF